MSAGNDADNASPPSIASRWWMSPTNFRLWLMAILLAAGLIGGAVFLARNTAAWWSAFAFVGLSLAILGLIFAGWMFWYWQIADGRWTWMRLAQRPILERQRGNAEAAERAFAVACARALAYGEKDRRRGMMLGPLGLFARYQGRHQQSLEFFEEATSILERTMRRSNPAHVVQMVNALLLLAQTHNEVRDFTKAQQALEKIADLAFVAAKTDELTFTSSLRHVVESLQVVLSLNVAVVFLHMRALPQARHHLLRTTTILEQLPSSYHLHYADSYQGALAYLETLSGNLDAARDALAKLRAPNESTMLYIAAKLELAGKNYANAEATLRKVREAEAVLGTLRRPALLEAALDLADAQYCQGKFDEAFAMLMEARSIVVDFAMPMDALWHEAWVTWLERARNQGRREWASTLESDLELAAKHPPVEHVTILDKFGVQSQSSQ